MSPSPPQLPPDAAPAESGLFVENGAAAGGPQRLLLGFLGNVNAVFFANLAAAALTFAAGVLIARALGPDGRGVYALFVLSASIAQAVLGLGLAVAAVYYLGKGAYSAARVTANGQHITIFAAVVCGLLALLLWPLIGQDSLDRGAPYWLFILAVPLLVDYNYLTAVLQGLSRFLAMNAVVLIQPAALLVLAVAAIASGDLGSGGAVALWAASVGVALLLALALLGRSALSPELLRFDAPSMAAQVRFGVQGQIGNLLQILNYRLDQYLVLAFVSTAAVGIYAVSSMLSQIIWFLPNAVAAVLLPRLTAATPDDAAGTTPVACRNTLMVSALAALALGVVAPWLIPALFGGDFDDAVVPFVWLLPGAVALAGSKVLTSYIFSQGRPLTNSLVTAVALAVTIVADLILIPSLEVTGAAIASALAYVTHFALSLVAYGRLSGGSLWRAVLVQPSDVRGYVQAVRARLVA
jgi:O-antigen/teichoic acid export membrane protein